MNCSIAGVIVTYNRRELLLENLIAQETQIRKLDVIYIIDNASTDGTKDFIMGKCPVGLNIYYKRLEKNIGCAGAFALGIRLAIEHGNDWIYVMDDDGKPADSYSISKLVNGIEERQLNSSNLVIANSLVINPDGNLSFKINGTFDISKLSREKRFLTNEAKLWNGSLLSKGLIDAIGEPNIEFGFKGEEIDFKRRATNAGAIIFTDIDSLYFHPRIKEIEVKFLFKKIYFTKEPNWKYYYMSRNTTFQLMKQKKFFKIFLFKLKCLICLRKMKLENYESAKRAINKGIDDGKKGKLGLVPLDYFK